VVTSAYGFRAVRGRRIVYPILIRGTAAELRSINHDVDLGALYRASVLVGYEGAGVNRHKIGGA